VLTYMGGGLGFAFCIYCAVQFENIYFILYGILTLVFLFLIAAVLESLKFLIEERIYGEKDLEEDINNQDKEPETKENPNKDK